MTPITGLFVFTNMLLFAVICVLLRQLNRERDERREILARTAPAPAGIGQDAALRAHLESQWQEDMTRRWQQSTVTEEEGV